MTHIADLVDDCRARGVKITPQRLAIFEALLGERGHLSAEEIYEEVLPRFPSLSFATVYNTLELLVEIGRAREVIVDELRRRYDVNTEAHHHAVCRGCHTIIDVPASAIAARLLRTDLSAHGFRVEGATIEFTGLCAACADRAPV